MRGTRLALVSCCLSGLASNRRSEQSALNKANMYATIPEFACVTWSQTPCYLSGENLWYMIWQLTTTACMGELQGAKCAWRTSYIPVKLMMEASPAPIAILHSIRIQKLLAKAQPTEETVKIAIPQPASHLSASTKSCWQTHSP